MEGDKAEWRSRNMSSLEGSMLLSNASHERVEQSVYETF